MAAPGAVLALALAAVGAPGGVPWRLPPPPRALFTVAWHRTLEPHTLLEWMPVEIAGPAYDPASRTVLVATRDGWLHALGADGAIRWEYHADAPFSSAATVVGDTVYASCADGMLYALDLADGAVRWRYESKEELGTQPVVAEGMVFVQSFEDTVFAVDARTGAWRWHRRRERPAGFTIRGTAPVAVADGVVYAGFSDGAVMAIEARSGSIRWQRQVAPAGRYLDVDALLVDGGRVYAAAYSGVVMALDARQGSPIWQFMVPEPVRLAMARGTLVGVTTSSVIGLSPLTGKVFWTSPLGGSPEGVPVPTGRYVLVPAGAGGLRFVDVAGGQLAARLDRGGGVDAPPAIGAGAAYVMTNDGELLAITRP